MVAMSLTELDEDTVRSMAIGAVFSDFGGKINSLDFHRTDDLLVTASEDDSVRLYDIANAKLLKSTYHKKHGAEQICFTHHPSSVICSSKYNLDSTGESLRYLSMYDNRCLRYFKGHKERIVSLCMSPVNDSFMSGSLDHTARIWDLRVNACQGILHLRGRPTVAYDQQGLVFAVAMEGGAIKLFDSRSYDKGPFDTFLVGGDTAEVCNIKFSNDGKSMLLTTTNNNVYILDAYGGEKRFGFSVEPSPNSTMEATFTPDGRYVISAKTNQQKPKRRRKQQQEVGNPNQQQSRRTQTSNPVAQAMSRTKEETSSEEAEALEEETSSSEEAAAKKKIAERHAKKQRHSSLEEETRSEEAAAAKKQQQRGTRKARLRRWILACLEHQLCQRGGKLE